MSSTEVWLAQESAYEVIISETANSPGMETGGILVGRQVTYRGQSVLVVLAASGPGQSAQRSAISFAPDLDSHLAALDAWRQRYARYEVDFVGEWHKHPHGLPRPTAGDVRQARAILRDPDYVLPHGGVLIPIAQFGEQGSELQIFYVTRDRGDPLELPYRVVTVEELELFLKECLHGALEPVPPVWENTDAPRSNGAPSSRSRVTRWGAPPARLVGVTYLDEHTRPTGRVIIGEYQIVGTEPARALPEPEPAPAPAADNMAFQALVREIQRLERLGQHYGFTVQRPSGAELDYVELVFREPVPLPQPGVPPTARQEVTPADVTAEMESRREAMPRPGEPIQALRIAFPYNYPVAELSMWIIGNRDYPVKLEALRARGASTLEQRVDVLMHWLTTSHPKDLPGLIEANAEFLYRQGLQAVRKGVDHLDVLLKSLEERAGRNAVIADAGPDPV